MSHIRTLLITATRAGAVATAIINRGPAGVAGGGAHASTHATGGSDPITPASIGAATAAHTHDSAYLPLNDASVTNSREWTAATIDQSEAETGSATTRRAWTALRVRQAISAWWTTVSSTKADAGHDHSGVYLPAGDASVTNSREWTAATVEQAEAEAGTATTRRAWTSERVRQAIAAWWATVSSTKADAGHTHTGVYQPAGTYATGGGTATGTNTGDQDLSGLMVKANNLSDLTNAATARTNLGLGTAATTAATAYATAAQGALAASALQPSSSRVEAGNYTVIAADFRSYIELTSATPVITLDNTPPIGHEQYFRRGTSAGAITLSGSGQTILGNAASTVPAEGSFGVRKKAANTWYFI